MDLSIRFAPGADVPRKAIEEALKDGLEGAGTPQPGTKSEIRFTLDKRAPREKVLKVVRLTLDLVGIRRAKIVLEGEEVS